jgi:hypothetical protein
MPAAHRRLGSGSRSGRAGTTLFFAVTVTSLGGLVSDGVGTHRQTAVLALECIGAIAATVAATTEIAGNLWGPSIAVAVLAVVAGLLLLDRRRRPTDRLAWWIGAVLLPAVLLGGVLTVVNERLLELPLAFIAALWIWLGGLLLRQASKAPSR